MNDIGDITILLGGIMAGIPQIASRAQLRNFGRSILNSARIRFKRDQNEIAYQAQGRGYNVLAEEGAAPFTSAPSRDLDLSMLTSSVIIIFLLFLLFIMFISALHGVFDMVTLGTVLHFLRLLAYTSLVFLVGYLVSQVLGLLILLLTWLSYSLTSAKNRVIFVSANTIYHFLRRSTLYLTGRNYQRKFTTLGLVVAAVGVAINISSRHIY